MLNEDILNKKQIFICCFFLLLTTFCLAQNKKYPIIKSNKVNIHYWINQKRNNWSISPEINPDRLEIYSQNSKTLVKFKTDIDSIQFYLNCKDTVRFYILLNNKEKALTEVVSFNDLPNKIQKNDKLYYLSQFWSEAKYNFVNMDRIGFKWDSLYYDCINSVLNTKNDYDYYQELKRFAATLRDGHTMINDNSQFYMFKDYISIYMQDFNKKIYIVSITKNKGLDSTFLGAELIEVEGIPVLQYLKDKIFPFISASTEQHLWMQGVYKLHSDFRIKPFIAKFKKTNGEIKTINIPHNGETTRNNNDEHWGRLPENSPNIVDIKWLQDSIIYISVNSFNDKAIKGFDKYLPAIKKAKSLIIDLRKNGGGSTDVAWHIQACLTEGRFFLNYGWQTRINDGVGKANGNWMKEYKEFYDNNALKYVKPDTIYIPDSIKRITIPTVILISRFTFSAAEDLLVNLYEVPNRPIFIGESTGGSTGSPLVISNFPGNGYGRICTRRICFPYSGKPFIGEGINPDFIIKPTLQDYLDGKDIVLEKAIGVLKMK